MSVTFRPDTVGSQILSEGTVESQTPLIASGTYLSKLFTWDRADGVLMAYAQSDQSGTFYVLFTDSTGKKLLSSQPSTGLATSATTVPSGSGLTSVQAATIRTNFMSRYFYLYFVNGVTKQTSFEVGWKTQSS